jgi:hypothetical protein
MRTNLFWLSDEPALVEDETLLCTRNPQFHGTALLVVRI